MGVGRRHPQTRISRDASAPMSCGGQRASFRGRVTRLRGERPEVTRRAWPSLVSGGDSEALGRVHLCGQFSPVAVFVTCLCCTRSGHRDTRPVCSFSRQARESTCPARVWGAWLLPLRAQAPLSAPLVHAEQGCSPKPVLAASPPQPSAQEHRAPPSVLPEPRGWDNSGS